MPWTKEQLKAASEIEQARAGRYPAVLADAIRWESLGLGLIRFADGVPHFDPCLEWTLYVTPQTET